MKRLVLFKNLFLVFLILIGTVAVLGLKGFAQDNGDNLTGDTAPIILELKDLRTESGEIKGTLNYTNKTGKNFNDLVLQTILQEKFKQEEITEKGSNTTVLTPGKVIIAKEEKPLLIKPQESGSVAVSLIFPKSIASDLYRFRIILADALGNAIVQAQGGIKIQGGNKFSETGVSDCSIVKGEQKFNFG